MYKQILKGMGLGLLASFILRFAYILWIARDELSVLKHPRAWLTILTPDSNFVILIICTVPVVLFLYLAYVSREHIDFKKYRYRIILGLLSGLASLILLLQSADNWWITLEDLIFPLIFNIITVSTAVCIGWILDTGRLKSGVMAISLFLAIIPWFSDLLSLNSIEANPYALPFYLGFTAEILIPGAGGGHPPLAVYLAPVLWILLGIIGVTIIYFREK